MGEACTERVGNVAASGDITTVAGKGTGGLSRDGGAAASASLRSPKGVAVDSAGNLVIADGSNSRIRKVDTKSIMSTIAGAVTFG